MQDCRKRQESQTDSGSSSRNSPMHELPTANICSAFLQKIQHDISKLCNYDTHKIKWVNEKPNKERKAYNPTEIEHIANIITHGFWILPALYAAFVLLVRSNCSEQVLVALIYGSALVLLFLTSTAFHCVFYIHKNLLLKDVLHRMDRAMIYIFIAGSYFPWLTLNSFVGENHHSVHVLGTLKWAIWIFAVLGILYQQVFHEKYKSLETILYMVISCGPASLIIYSGHEFTGMWELKIGGLFYLVGVFFFKSDGKIACAHAIWHLFVVVAASFHYVAILKYLYSEQHHDMGQYDSNITA